MAKEQALSDQPAKKKRKKKRGSTEKSTERPARGSTDDGPGSAAGNVSTPRDELVEHPHVEEAMATDRVTDEAPPVLPGGLVDQSSKSPSRGELGEGNRTVATLDPVTEPQSGVPPPSSALGASSSPVDRPITRRFKTVFPDKVSFSFDEASPLISNGPRCAKLVGQIKGGPRSLPPADQLVFPSAFKDASRNFLTAGGSFNFLVEKYDSEFKRVYAESGEAREKVKDGKKRIKSLKASLKRVEAEKEEALRRAEVKAMRAEDILSRFESMRDAAAKVEKEKAALFLDKFRLEREKLELIEAHAKEAARLRESRVFEVTKERARVTAVMCTKMLVRMERIRNREASFPQFDDARLRYSQAFGTRKCLELLQKKGDPIPQERIEYFRKKEEHWTKIQILLGIKENNYKNNDFLY
ncbi:unnamed protein product [Eruca vesicaria subsp. sativa]|uniref:Uncharacterized protein n=1 Tax=Eruca vesicaria subsp. sativa TaxID=29727 RepID=A0ABC8LNG3_ERUVS|nr:unnamed protein product [Eruca vesicaria subsp. sativa]